MISAWVLASLVAFTIAHLVLVAIALRLDAPGATAPTGTGDDLECPDCGTANEPGYRYCRQCVSPLPGGTAIARRDDRPTGRRTL